ncbi:hypothetical protein ACIPJM_04505 [Streptomyces halstedii]|uniref:hypothetical protein n=1 Tax=Streptomyces halstedii TaxID=1944 RepID=UPI003801CEB2
MRATIATVLLAAVAGLALVGCNDTADSGSGSSKPGAVSGSNKPATTPTYKITEQDTTGSQRTVIVQVDTAENLDLVYKAVKAELTDEAVYLVGIECSTGGSSYDRRLANGRYVLGAAGAAEAGLPAGTSEYQPAGEKCPA